MRLFNQAGVIRLELINLGSDFDAEGHLTASYWLYAEGKTKEELMDNAVIEVTGSSGEVKERAPLVRMPYEIYDRGWDTIHQCFEEASESQGKGFGFRFQEGGRIEF